MKTPYEALRDKVRLPHSPMFRSDAKPFHVWLARVLSHVAPRQQLLDAASHTTSASGTPLGSFLESAANAAVKSARPARPTANRKETMKSQDIRSIVEKAMKGRGLSARALAHAAGLGERQVQHFLAGDSAMNHRDLERIFAILELRIEGT